MPNEKEAFLRAFIFFIIMANIKEIILRTLLFLLIIVTTALLCYNFSHGWWDSIESSTDCIKYICNCSDIVL